MNSVQLIGRMTKDIELKRTQAGKVYCNFSLAVPREFNREEADFINCVAWEKKAETITKYVKKGHRFGIIGRLQIDKNNDVYYTKIIVEKIEFLERFKNETSTTQNKTEIEDEDFPF